MEIEAHELQWHWLGGRPALDLVNTLGERWRRRIERLRTPEDLGRWLAESGVVAQAPEQVPRAVLTDARALREAIDACVQAVVAGAPVPEEAVRVIDRALVTAGARPQLVTGADGLPVLGERGAGDSPRRALGLVALDAARMLGTPAERARIRVCASETCSARFFDRSPAGRRQWCSMERCGNVEKARRHRARKRVVS